MEGLRKHPYAKFPITLAFPIIPDGETIIYHDVKAFQGSMDVTSQIIGSFSLEGKEIKVMIQGGESGKVYEITGRVRTSSGLQEALPISLEVRGRHIIEG